MRKVTPSSTNGRVYVVGVMLYNLHPTGTRSLSVRVRGEMQRAPSTLGSI